MRISGFIVWVLLVFNHISHSCDYQGEKKKETNPCNGSKMKLKKPGFQTTFFRGSDVDLMLMNSRVGDQSSGFGSRADTPDVLFFQRCEVVVSRPL